MSTTKRSRRAIVLGLALVGTISAGGSGDAAMSAESSSGASAPASGNDLVIGTYFEPATLDAHVSQTTYLQTFSINEALVEFDGSGALQPLLAESLPTLVEGSDDLRWRVPLKQGITFTNGEPFNAEAVVANVNRILDPETASDIAGDLAGIGTAEVVDEYTVEFVTERPNPILPNQLVGIRMVPPVAAQDPEYGNNPIGTGPMLFESWERGGSVFLTPNPSYWGPNPATISGAEIRFIEDPGTRMSALQAGEIDIAAQISPDEADEVPQTLSPNGPGQLSVIRVNLNNPPYDDVNFRQALQYAIDKEAINEALFAGTWSGGNCQPVAPTTFGFNPTLTAYPYDPDKAIELLSSVTIPDGFKVVLDGSNGFFVKEKEVAEVLKSYWEAIGLQVELVFNETDPYIEKLFDGRDSTDLFNVFTDQVYHDASKQLVTYLSPDGPSATIGDAYPELDPLRETALTSMDPAEREAAYQEIWKIVCDDAILLSSVDSFDLWGMASNVTYDPGSRQLTAFKFNDVAVS